MSLSETFRCEDCQEIRALCLCTHEDWQDDVDILGLDKTNGNRKLLFFVKNIHADPFAIIKDLTVRDYYALAEHVKVCNTCDGLLEEVYAKYPNPKPDPKYNDGRWN